MDTKQLDEEYVLHTYARQDINFTKGHNAVLYDQEGRDYIDFGSGIAVSSVGHGNKRLADAICTQAQNLIHTSNLFSIKPQAQLAQKLCERSGFDMRTFFANSGAEANEAAIKIARRYGEEGGEPKRYKIVTLQHSFHGRSISTLKATGQESMHNYFGPYPDGFDYAADIDDIYNKIDDHTVAVMIELVQGEGGIEPLSKAKVQELSKALRQKDILLIVDEVQTGIYRTGELLASNLYEIQPDVVTLAKGLGGGVPIGAVMTGLKDIFAPGDHGSTFGGNYLSTQAGLTVLDILHEYEQSGRLDEHFLYFSQKLDTIAQKYTNLFEKSVGMGLMRGLRAKNADIVKDVFANCLDQGVIVLKSGRNTVRFLPVLTITKEEIDRGFERFEKAIAKL
ncbi:MAG: aspartate aminotransferase family protein [Campylobacterota bacterium]